MLPQHSWVSGEDSQAQTLNQRDGAETEGQEAGAQQVPQSRQVGDGEVVGVQTSSPHQTDNEIGNIEQDGHLSEENKGQLI